MDSRKSEQKESDLEVWWKQKETGVQKQRPYSHIVFSSKKKNSGGNINYKMDGTFGKGPYELCILVY